jgi:RND family efflux transporter MFP subunit
VQVKRGSITSSLKVAGQFIPYQVVDLHAKVSGYIQWIKVDIGDLVTNGEVLAYLEVPELQDQFQGAKEEVKHTQAQIVQAQSEVAAAKAAYFSLHLDYTRLAEASKERPGLIAQQEIDDAQARDQKAEAQIGVAEAALQAMQQQLGVAQAAFHRYQSLTEYQSIVAPYTGVVTMRYGNVGSLIQAGQDSNTQAMPVVQVSQSDLLRLRTPIPESDVQYIKLNGDVQIRVSSNGRIITGKIVRFTRALDPNTRTMLVEVDIPNPDLTLSPGMYAEDTFQLQHKDDALTLPIQAVVRNGNQAYVLVVDSTNHIQKRNVTLGIESANTIEITSGLQQGETVIASGQDNYEVGEAVTSRPAIVPTSAQEESE